MYYLELQQRANQIVSKVNNYEAGLAKYEITEADILAEHKYADLYTLRAVMNLLFGSTVDQKCDRSLNIPTDLRLFASTVPMWNTTFNLIPKQNEVTYTRYNKILTVVGSPTNNDGIVSGLTDNSKYMYISSNNYPSNDFKEVVLVFTVSETNQFADLWIDDHTRMYLSLNYDSLAAWDTVYSSLAHILNITSNTTYYIKIVKNERSSTQYRIDYYQSTDQGASWTLLTSIAQNKFDSIHNVGVFGNANNSSFIDQFTGQANLRESYYKLDGDDTKHYLYEREITGVDYEVKSDKHEFISDIDALNNYNLIHLDALENTVTSRDQRIKQGINYSYSSNIADALVTESQVANMFKWNTTDPNTIPNNTMTLNRQVPGIVVYTIGPDYDKFYTSTIGYNPTTSKFNAVNYGNPSTYGSYYRNDDVKYSQYSHETPTFASEFASCKVFMTGMNYTRGKLESPQQIWQPAEKYGDDNIGYGYNRQGQATYHELVFKNRRKGSGANSVDFTPARSDIPDNDPQGLALRSVLAQQRDFYNGRPWFKELDVLYGANMSKFAANINQSSKLGSGSGSFDRGKFNLVGSPTLSDTGILSNFSTSNYVTVTLPPINTNSEIEITLPKFNFTNNIIGGSYDPVFGFNRSDDYGFNISGITTSYVTINQFDNSSESTEIFAEGVNLNGKQAILKISNNIVYLVADNQEYATKTLDADITLPITLYIGKVASSDTTFDLSPLRIVVDGVEVFTAKSVSETYMTDQDFYTNYKLSYDTYAESLNQPK